MSTILNIETATRVCSVFLGENGEIVSGKDTHIENSHSEYLTVYIEELLAEQGIKAADLDAIAVSMGPGSYTGLRIGLSVAKGLCYSIEKPLIGISTLQSMAHGASTILNEDSAFYCPMIDARRMEVYCMLADIDDHILVQTQAKIIDKTSFEEYLANQKIVFFGNGSAKCKEALSHEKNAIFINDIHPSAEHIGAMAWRIYEEKQFEDLAYFEPFYLKDFIAKKPSAKKLV